MLVFCMSKSCQFWGSVDEKCVQNMFYKPIYTVKITIKVITAIFVISVGQFKLGILQVGFCWKQNAIFNLICVNIALTLAQFRTCQGIMALSQVIIIVIALIFSRLTHMCLIGNQHLLQFTLESKIRTDSTLSAKSHTFNQMAIMTLAILKCPPSHSNFALCSSDWNLINVWRRITFRYLSWTLRHFRFASLSLSISSKQFCGVSFFRQV